jgi:hypothetical protein
VHHIIINLHPYYSAFQLSPKADSECNEMKIYSTRDVKLWIDNKEPYTKSTVTNHVGENIVPYGFPAMVKNGVVSSCICCNLGPIWEGFGSGSTSGSRRSPPKRLVLQRLQVWSYPWSTSRLPKGRRSHDFMAPPGSALLFPPLPLGWRSWLPQRPATRGRRRRRRRTRGGGPDGGRSRRARAGGAGRGADGGG